MKYNYLHLAVLAALSFVVIVLLGINSLQTAAEDKKSIHAMSLQKSENPTLFESPPLPKIFTVEGSSMMETNVKPKIILPKYQALYAQNSDLAGWLEIEGTPLNLPVMYTPQDGEYYLKHFFDKSNNQYGTPFIDARCAPDSSLSNLIIHGHNMKDDEMFGTLPLYAKKEYFEEHPIIKFDTLYETGEYQIVSAFLSQYDANDTSTKLYYYYTDLSEETKMREFSTLVKELSLYETGVTLQPGDETITLITCSYHTTNGRMNVVAKKIKDTKKID